jgi:hypothetical protein
LVLDRYGAQYSSCSSRGVTTTNRYSNRPTSTQVKSRRLSRIELVVALAGSRSR